MLHKIESGEPGVLTRLDPPEENLGLSGWMGRFKQRQEMVGVPRDTFGFGFNSHVLINLISDMHIGHPTTDYKRIEDEVNAITRTPNSYVLFAGDLINNMNWNPGQFDEMEQTPEQIAFLFSIFEHFANNGKLMHSIQGDHDGWVTKAGFNLHSKLKELGVSTSNGPTFFKLEVGSKYYTMAGAHQLPGHSIYNVNHPQMRAVRFGSMHGADIVFSGHNHKKGVALAYQHELGEPRETTYIALGPYKAGDEWLSKKGWPIQRPEEMFGVAVYLSALEESVQTELDIVLANNLMGA